MSGPSSTAPFERRARGIEALGQAMGEGGMAVGTTRIIQSVLDMGGAQASGLLSAVAASLLGTRGAAAYARDLAGVLDCDNVGRRTMWTDGTLALVTLRRL